MLILTIVRKIRKDAHKAKELAKHVQIQSTERRLLDLLFLRLARRIIFCYRRGQCHDCGSRVPRQMERCPRHVARKTIDTSQLKTTTPKKEGGNLELASSSLSGRY
uniref:Phorbol-ester/DAG-type domain-containing protein n=1 Tax=Panagrellus redivivus TaxID=6233 RepID=A0A7E5A036_PANRE